MRLIPLRPGGGRAWVAPRIHAAFCTAPATSAPFLGAPAVPGSVAFEGLGQLDLPVHAELLDSGRLPQGLRAPWPGLPGGAVRRVFAQAAEVSLSGAVGPDDVRHPRWLEERIGPSGAVVTTGPQAYRRPNGGMVVGPRAPGVPAGTPANAPPPATRPRPSGRRVTSIVSTRTEIRLARS